MLHTMKDGKQIRLADMGDGHLLNTLAMMYRKAESGVVVRRGGMSIGDNEPWFDEGIVYGDEAFSEMRTAVYEAEAARRKLKTPNAKVSGAPAPK
jgi:hypothetical protein